MRRVLAVRLTALVVVLGFVMGMVWFQFSGIDVTDYLVYDTVGQAQAALVVDMVKMATPVYLAGIGMLLAVRIALAAKVSDGAILRGLRDSREFNRHAREDVDPFQSTQ